MTDDVFPPVKRVVDSHTELHAVAKEFARQLGAAYRAREAHGIEVRWEFVGRDFKDNSEGGVW